MHVHVENSFSTEETVCQDCFQEEVFTIWGMEQDEYEEYLDSHPEPNFVEAVLRLAWSQYDEEQT